MGESGRPDWGVEGSGGGACRLQRIFAGQDSCFAAGFVSEFRSACDSRFKLLAFLLLLLDGTKRAPQKFGSECL
jgi:hypothetical protein